MLLQLLLVYFDGIRIAAEKDAFLLVFFPESTNSPAMVQRYGYDWQGMWNFITNLIWQLNLISLAHWFPIRSSSTLQPSATNEFALTVTYHFTKTTSLNRRAKGES